MKIRTIVGSLVLLAFAGCIAIFPIDQARMSSYCSSVQVGEPVASARQRAMDTIGFKATPIFISDGKQLFLVHSPLSFGRFVCEIGTDGSRVTSKEFNSSD